MSFQGLSKADVLLKLKPLLTKSVIEDIFVFTISQWRRGQEELIGEIQSQFDSSQIIVRSSTSVEDTQNSSMAGKFTSIIDVDAFDVRSVERAVTRVIKSYQECHLDIDQEQILVQRQTKDVAMSGVVFSRHMETQAPYYIINYDDHSGKTNFVTAGLENKIIVISRAVRPPYHPRWSRLIESVKEIEVIWKKQTLDIEFAITKDDCVVIFQVRPLIIKDPCSVNDQFVFNLIEDMKGKFKRFSKGAPHLCGQKTVYGDMPDWNPAEIIGDQPNTLDYTIYRFLITNNIWHDARSALGYVDVFPGELMTSFGRKPYIDTRLSFNSMIPADLSKEIREKLVNFYLKKLSENPHLQDKVEFEILWTCYDFCVEDKASQDLMDIFSNEEIQKIIDALRKITFDVVLNSDDIFKKNLESIETLNERRVQTLEHLDGKDITVWEYLTGAHYILNNCRKHGTYPFSLLARVAFIAQSFLLSMVEKKIITQEIYDTIFLSVETIAKKLTSDFNQFNCGRMSKEEFLTTYGHLRSGTYDITSARYDQMKHFLDKENELSPYDQVQQLDKQRFAVDDKAQQCIQNALKKIGLHIGADQFINFIIRATEYRELSKFEFTKSLSDSIELFVKAGEKLGIRREDLCHVDLNRLMSSRNPDISDENHIREVIQASIERHRKEREWYKSVILPPVIRSQEDFDYVEFYTARPNFITNKCVQGETVVLNGCQGDALPEIKGRIVLIENADPGYDWIFVQDILGLITKYGGIASHMAIRCAEFGIPAVIGCGENIYNQMLSKKKISLDCSRKELFADAFDED